MARRDNGEKFSISKNELSIKIKTILEEIQNNLFNQAKEFRNKNTHDVKTYDEFKNIIKEWYELGSDYHNIDDSPSIIPNDSNFIEHRHDQSIFTNLMNKHEMPTRIQGDYNPGYHDGSWTLGQIG
mgnify:CR=1 FL=1